MTGSSVPLPDLVTPDSAKLAIAHGEPERVKLRNPKKRKDSPNETSLYDKQRYTPWIDTLGMTEYESKDQRLHDEIVAFAAYIAPTVEEVSARQLVVSRIRDIVQERFRGSTVSVFGSIAQDLCLPDSDIDLVVRAPAVRSKKEAITKALGQIRYKIKDSGVVSNIIVIGRARVPIISMTTRPHLGSFDIDLSMNTEDGLQAIDILNVYLRSMPALRPLILVLKAFLSQRKFNDAALGGLSSFVLISMTISFLQLNPGKRPQEFLDKPMEKESLGMLLVDFFHYYGYTFPYGTSYISVAEGKLATKKSKGWIKKSDPEALSVQSLIDPSRDIGGGVSRIQRIRAAFKEAFNTLNNLTSTTVSANVLGSLVYLSQKTLDRRENVQQIVKSGKLQQIVNLLPAAPHNYERLPKQGSRSSHPRPYHTYGPSSRTGHTGQYLPPPPPSAYYNHPPLDYGRGFPRQTHDDYEYDSRSSFAITTDDYRLSKRQRTGPH